MTKTLGIPQSRHERPYKFSCRGGCGGCRPDELHRTEYNDSYSHNVVSEWMLDALECFRLPICNYDVNKMKCKCGSNK